MTATRQDFAELARTLKSVMSEGQGFALLMQLGGQYHYASIADRADIHTTLTEWLARASVHVSDQDETPERASSRLKLEAKCVELGYLLEAEGHRLLLFLFDYGDRGHLAWWTNAPDAIEVVKRFLGT